jgi:hypothetical protein
LAAGGRGRPSEDNTLAKLSLDHLKPLRERLDAHPIYASLRSLDDLRVFMSHHLFSVWDFMSLVKYMQRYLAPAQVPWMPGGDTALKRFINQLVLEEESDLAPGGEEAGYASHFELYARALTEIGGDGGLADRFIARVREQGLDAALYSDLVPLPARYFVETTFAVINEDKPHEVAAALALGREQVIPDMFRRFIAQSGLTIDQAPSFHYYLERHIHLDGELHGPLSLRMLDQICAGDPSRIEEAETAAEEAICARLRFWDGVLDAIERERASRPS